MMKRGVTRNRPLLSASGRLSHRLYLLGFPADIRRFTYSLFDLALRFAPGGEFVMSDAWSTVLLGPTSPVKRKRNECRYVPRIILGRR
jgi:hypothetical protein